MIKRWHYAMGGWKEKDIRVIAVLQEDHWYWVLAEWLSGSLMYICSWLHNVPLPKIVRETKGHWDKDDPEYYATFEDWFGDDLGSLWHCYVEDPITRWVWQHTNYANDVCIEMTLDEARKKFGAEHDAVKWVEKELEQRKQWDAEKLAEVRKAYADGGLTREQALEKLEWWFEGENLEALLDGQSGEKAEITVS